MGPLVPANLQLFLWLGQSNAMGGALLPASPPASPHVFAFGNDYLWHQAQEPLDDNHGQVDAVSYDEVGPGSIYPASGYSAGTNFGIAVQSAIGLDVGLIPCAKGGSSIAQWQRAPGRDTLYGSALYRAQQASKNGTLAGVIYYQGEYEAVTALSPTCQPTAWAQYFTAIVSGLRLDLGNPSLPVVFAQIGPISAAYPNAAVVRAQQASISIPKVAMVTTLDLTLIDAVHLDTASQDTLAQRLSAAYLTLIGASGGGGGGGSVCCTASPTSLVHGGTVTVAWSAAPTAWQFGLYNAGAAAGYAGYLGLQYVNGSYSMAPGAPIAAGSVTWGPLTVAGNYTVRLFDASHVFLAETAAFTVAA